MSVEITGPRVRRNDYGRLSPPGLGAWKPTRTLSVVIPAYQCQADLDLALAALRHQTYPRHLLEVVVVDDGSRPPLRLPRVRPENCQLIRAPERSWGRAAALHAGAQASGGEILHWLDADLIPFPEHVAAQARWQHASGDVVTLGYKRYVRDGATTPLEVVARCTTGTLDRLFPLDGTDPHDYVEELIDDTDQLRAADHLAFRAHVGATAALTRALYLSAGGMDTTLRLGEDSEFGFRLAQAGAVFVPEPRARSWHLGVSHMMRAGDQLRRYNRPFLADRMPHPQWLRRVPGRCWVVPLVTAVVRVPPDSTLERVSACVDSLLAGGGYELRVVLVGDWPVPADQPRAVLEDPALERRLIATCYRSDPRVVLAAAPPDSVFPSPYRLEVPGHLAVSRTTIGAAIAEADKRRLGLLRLVPPGGGGSTLDLWRTAAVSRARRHQRPDEPLVEAVAELWGAGWAGGRGVVDLTAPAAAPARASGVRVAGLRSLLRATGHVARLTAARGWQRAVHLVASLWSPSSATVPPVHVVQSLRRRVRLRTRLRRTRERWRRATRRRLPEWREPALAAGPPPLLSPDGARVDARAANPRGRTDYGPRLPAGRLLISADPAGAARWQVVRESDGRAVVVGRVGDPLDAPRAAVLAELGLVTSDPEPEAPVAAHAHLLAELAMTGVLVHAPRLRPEVAARLAPELTGLLRAPLPGRRGDPLEWEIRSIRQRRAALRHHAAGLDRPLVSAILVTKRPHLLVPALAALAAQTYPELEIVVARHGHDAPVPDGAGGDRPVVVRTVPAERNLGEALAAATRAATGALLTKVDDDDRYGPEHIWDLVLARHFAGAAVVGKGAELVYLEPKDLTVRRRMAAETFTDTVAGGTLLLSREDLTELGGWPPVPRWVDRALLDRVLGEGGDVYRTHPLGFVYTRHGHGHTWEADLDHFLVDARRKWRGLPPNAELGRP